MKKLLGVGVALLMVAGVANATTIRIDFAGAKPADGTVETFAPTYDAGFGSIGGNIWNAGVGNNLLDSAGVATTVDVAVSSTGSSTSGGDWRQTANATVGALAGQLDFNPGSITIDQMAVSTTVKVWLYFWDARDSGPGFAGITMNGTTTFGTFGTARIGWSTGLTDVNAPSPASGFGMGFTGTSDATGKMVLGITGAQGSDRGISGMQIYYAPAGNTEVPEPGTWLLLGGSLLGLCVGGFRRFVRK